MRMIDFIGLLAAGVFAVLFRQLADWKRLRNEMREQATADNAAGVRAHWFNQRSRQRHYDAAMWRIRKDEFESYVQ